MKKAMILGGKRTPIGSFLGSLSSVSAVDLGGQAVKAAIGASKLGPGVSEVIVGNVISAGLGQNPARQIASKAGVSSSVPTFLVNKVCASGLKTVTLASTNIMTGFSESAVAAGAESMSQAPHFLRMRAGLKFGDGQVLDTLTTDGLVDAFRKIPMGTCAEKTARELGLTREAQDEFCISSYEKALAAQKAGIFDWEIVGVEVAKQGLVAQDEEPKRFDREKVSKVRPAFPPFEAGAPTTVTAANASKLNDGACALILASEEAASRAGAKPLAQVLSFADAEIDSLDFNVCPAVSAKKALALAGLTPQNVDLWEFNEAFAVTGLANILALGIDAKKVNVHGGAVALGHPIGMSGARIVLSLVNALRVKGGKIGVASVCNGGGGSTAIVIKNLQA